MQISAEPAESEGGRTAFIVALALLGVAVVAIVIALFLRREPDYALVLATPQDCLRAFDDAKCRRIVALAMEVHASTAPRFDDQNVCAMQFGGACTAIALLSTT